VSHETIYRSLFIQARGAPKKQLIGPCAQDGGLAGHTLRLTVATAKGLSAQFRYARDPQKLKIERSRVTGRAILKKVHAEPSLPL
jgi:hypothetical protein